MLSSSLSRFARPAVLRAAGKMHQGSSKVLMSTQSFDLAGSFEVGRRSDLFPI